MTRSAAALLTAAALSVHAQPKPAFVYEDILDGFFGDDNGTIVFTDYDLAFAPDAPLNAAIAVTDAEGTVIKSFSFWEDYRYREGVFAKAMVQGPADVTLTEPGLYNIVFLVDGEMATRLPVLLEQTGAGDDPFDPVKTYRFDGLWRTLAHFTEHTFKDVPHYTLTFWVGGRDLAEGDRKDQFIVRLYRDGELIGHSKRTQGHIAPGHYERVDATICPPHERNDEYKTPNLTKADLTADGDYTVVVARQSDDEPIRSFAYTAEGGAIRPLPATELGFEPRVDYIVPRVTKKGSNTYGFVEAVWITSE